MPEYHADQGRKASPNKTGPAQAMTLIDIVNRLKIISNNSTLSDETRSSIDHIINDLITIIGNYG